MKKCVVLAAVLGVMFAIIPAHAGPNDFVATDNIKVGDGIGGVIGGVDENYFFLFCKEQARLRGSDGSVVQLPATAAGKAATLTSTDATGLADVDAYFYDADCNLIDYFDMGNLGLNDETGTVPADAAYAVIDLNTGVNATYTFTVTDGRVA